MYIFVLVVVSYIYTCTGERDTQHHATRSFVLCVDQVFSAKD